MFRILVVEDDKDLCELFCRTLEKNDFIALAAENADRALEKLDSEYVDLMISDVMMPGMDGFELTRELREAGIDIPVLIITAKGDITDKQAGFGSGADDYMVKPVDLNEMKLYVEDLNPQGLRGDVNDDHAVNISDVTSLIDYLLSGNAENVNLVNADCNLVDGVNIADVTSLIDFLLSGTWPAE
jgi:DNA-binding response OmpR family regulator